MSSKNNGPVQTLRDGALKATIWQNESDNGTYFSTNLSKVYRKNNAFHETQNFSGSDLLKVAELARQAYSVENTLRANLYQSATLDEAPAASSEQPTQHSDGSLSAEYHDHSL